MFHANQKQLYQNGSGEEVDFIVFAIFFWNGRPLYILYQLSKKRGQLV